MTFVSLEYLVLVITSVLIYYLVPKSFRWLVILATNIAFYASVGVNGLITILGNVLFVYAVGIMIERITKYKKLICAIYVVAQVVVLFSFKYEMFWDITAPMAISFYSLTCIGYVMDVYRGKYVAQCNPLKLAAFISFFPTMVQGPICRYDEVSKSMFQVKDFDFEKFTYGLMRIFYGVIKKLVLADRLSIIFDALSLVSDNGATFLLNGLVYAFYLYLDFSGGIDIALGTGHLFGITLPENFNNPFFAKSISDYWRRWHMSLGTWLRDYVFYPVSFSKPVVKISKAIRNRFGNKVSKKIPIYVATLIVWFITGIWHGTNGNFILWGMLNAVIILISYELEGAYKKFNDRFSCTKGKLYNGFRIVRTFALMGVLRMLDYNTVIGYFKSLKCVFTDFNLNELKTMAEIDLVSADYIVILVGLIILLLVALMRGNKSCKDMLSSRGVVFSYGIIALMIATVVIFGMYGIGYEGKDFIYIRY